jgi:GDP/UDP-N,N'-diacetylbacillosamine 2-epimerase (hydrolysing)
MHLSKKHGSTYKIIEKDGFKIDKTVKMPLQDDTNLAMVKSLGDGIRGLADAIDDLSSDIVVVLGDRSEALAGALAGAYLNKIVAHIHGGEVTKGCIDESIRHAITKFAHIHFPTSYDSAKRIERMGEQQKNIHIYAAPGLEAVRNKQYTMGDQLHQKYKIPRDKPLILVIQHPVTQEPHKARSQIQATIEALLMIDAFYILVYPNNDAGGQTIIDTIESANLPQNFRKYINIPREDFLGLMNISSVMVGNSSSGIIEAPSFNLPVVNVGIRQEGRLRAENVVDAPHEKDAIIKAVRKTLFDESFQNIIKSINNPYEKGSSSEQVAKILEALEITEDLLQKQITY